MEDMIEVVIDSVRVSLMSPQRVVVLRQTDAERYLPIYVGSYEAEAITVAMQEIEMSRPLTHDLLKNVFQAFNGRILRVEITKLRDDTFYGNIVAEMDGTEISIDSRPSDAIALAVRAHVPILVHARVLETAGIIPEQEVPSTPPPTETSSAAKGPGSGPSLDVSSDRLSIFEDFINKLDDKTKPEDDSPPTQN